MTKKKTPRLFVLGYIIFLASYLLSIAGSYIQPSVWAVPSLFSLGFLYLFFIHLLLAVFVFWWNKKRGFFLLLVTCIGLGPISKSFGRGLPLSKTAASSDLHVMSWNVRLFDLYSWSKNSATKANMFKLLDSANADVYCFQEFFRTENPNYVYPTLDSLIPKLNTPNYFEAYTHSFYNQFFGLTVLSKLPIVDTGRIAFNQPGNLVAYIDVLKNNDTVRIYNMHLASIRFKPEDYKFVSEITQYENGVDNYLKGSKNILGKLSLGFLIREQQVSALINHINSCPYPFVVCGDLNDTPSSISYRTLRKKTGAKDGFIDCGFGLGTTYNGPFPSFRIDYILYSPNMQATQFERKKVALSDHYPISCHLRFNTSM